MAICIIYWINSLLIFLANQLKPKPNLTVCMMLVARCVKQQLDGEELEMAAGKLEKAMKGYI